MSLEQIEIELRKYCHVVGCPTYKWCPEDCCRKESYTGRLDPMLGMDTAISWHGAFVISAYLETPYKKYKLMYYDKMMSLRAIMYLSSSSKEYPRISELFAQARDLMAHGIDPDDRWRG